MIVESESTSKKYFVSLLALSAFSALLIGTGFILKTSLYWDTPFFFGVFRDNLHALNRFGEFAWWFPHKQLGYPAFYYSILGQVSVNSPLFILTGAFCWLLGVFNIHIAAYHCFFVIYTAFLTPLMISLGVLLLARQIFKNPTVVFFVLILSAVSPGVFFNLSDVGLVEPAAYSLFFFAAYNNYIARPARGSFWILTLSLMLLLFTFTFPFLFWNIVAIPAFLLITSFIPAGNFSRIRKAVNSVPRYYWLLLLVLSAAAFLPAFMTYVSVPDLIRSKSGIQFYEFDYIKPGNPIELMAIGIPGFGMEWSGQGLWGLFPLSSAQHRSLYYQGILCLPLTIFAIMYGGTIIRRRLLAGLMLLCGVVCLATYSPFVASIMILPTPLKSNNHFSDCLFRSGGYLFFIFSSAYGLNLLLKKRIPMLKKALNIFLGYFALAVCFYIFAIPKKPITENLYFGFFLVMSVGYLAVLSWYGRCSGKWQLKNVSRFLLLLVLIDISTIYFWEVRSALNRTANRAVDETTNLALPGMQRDNPGAYANYLLMYKPFFEMTGSGMNSWPWALPTGKLFSSAHVAEPLGKEMASFAAKGDDYNSIALNITKEAPDNFKKFMERPPVRIGGSMELKRLTYNTLHLALYSQDEAILFLRDAYSPFWKATVNGRETDIVRAFYNFKAIVVPKGRSEISFKIFPRRIMFSYAAALAAFLTVLALAGFSRKKELAQSAQLKPREKRQRI